MKTLFNLLLIIAFNFSVLSQNCIPKAPNPPRLVNDYANILSPSQEAFIENSLVNFNDTTSTQIAVVTTTNLCELEASEFAFELGEKWKVGGKHDNGIVVLIKPKIGNAKGHAYIEVGYGLEGAVPDITATRIVNLEMIPFFKKQNYYDGIKQGVIVLMELTAGEYSAEDYANKDGRGAFPIVFVLFIIFLLVFKTLTNARRYSNTNNTGLLAALMLLNSGRSRHQGHFNNFTSGGGSFGGGGFGGFGGGSFGGGGGGGSW